MDNLILKPIPKGKGLTLKIAIDTDYAGFYFHRSKFRIEVCLGFIAFRLFFMSEQKYDYLQSIVVLEENCQSHTISISKEGENEESGNDK